MRVARAVPASFCASTTIELVFSSTDTSTCSYSMPSNTTLSALPSPASIRADMVKASPRRAGEGRSENGLIAAMRSESGSRSGRASGNGRKGERNIALVWTGG